MQFSLIIPAAGSGTRLGKDVPKPYLVIAGKSILAHTLNRFLKIDSLNQIIVVTSDDYLKETSNILKAEVGRLPFHVVKGGNERQESVQNALNVVSGESDLIAVHDAVRPFVSKTTIENCLNRASLRRNDGAIVAVPSRDTIKKIDLDSMISHTPKRDEMWLAQTPQIFKKKVLMEAYRFAALNGVAGTDDASLVERIGGVVEIVEGDIQNFKITYPLDLQLAEMILSKK
ncbi:2-C-methyl-D-erythritol 4-phosphate cytidylyltransferase [Rhodohalobacter halophilus]|uniref:2-C-methyl-D-erythritol 4-phosphate cytidylyltransferase n=1 Tax=Rhodohalobacter halophilus TaxID=1812810 RepID=UPI00083F827F|nr:2-C-methyl-D-erythritol 4-phosphate cytidylyltransferase [Rhodohalobacter halophilus]